MQIASSGITITKDWLEAKGACPEGYGWFVRNFGEQADYQDVLNALAKYGTRGAAWDWAVYAKVTAKIRPQNLVGGAWVQK